MKRYLLSFACGILGGIFLSMIINLIFLPSTTTTLKPQVVFDDFFEQRLQENQTSTFSTSLTNYEVMDNIILCIHNKNNKAMMCKAKKITLDSYQVTIQANQNCYPFIQETHVIKNELFVPCYLIILEIDANIQVPEFSV